MRLTYYQGWSIIFLGALLLGLSSCGPSPEEKRETLAKQLGVEVGIYEEQGPFPLGYYTVVLRKGMTIDEVHSIIQGYEKALQCKRREIYYYYSFGDSDVLRIEVWYDDRGIFKRVNGEDEDSPGIVTSDCNPGRIGDGE